MRRAEGIVHVDITQGGKFFCECFIVLLFFSMETEILEQQHFTGLQRIHRRPRGFADAVGGELHLFADQGGETFGHRLQRKLGGGFPFRPSEMAHQDHCAAFRQNLLDRRQGFYDALVVGHL